MARGLLLYTLSIVSVRLMIWAYVSFDKYDRANDSNFLLIITQLLFLLLGI